MSGGDDELAMRRARPLTSPSRIADLLERHGLSADKGFGQNFLIDASALTAIVDAAALRPSDTVFEVGPGLGTLTVELAAHARRVVSVELDRRLAPALAETLRGLGNVELIQGDAVRFDFATLPEGSVLVANLPYNVATAVLSQALASGRFTRMAFLVQREVADRLTAEAGAPAFGALTLLVRHFGRARRVRDVPPGAFLPPPKVTSSIVRIDVGPGVRPDPPLFELIRTGFAHRRKTLAKNLAMAGYAREAVHGALDRLGLDRRVRAEALDLDAFRALVGLLQTRTDRE